MDHRRRKIILAKIILGSLLCLINLSSSIAGAETQVAQNENVVIGTGTILDGNVAKARDMAISEALVKGVEVYLSKRLGSQGMTNNFPRLLQEVIPKANEGIENFHILAEERMDKAYKILVRVKVNDKVMEERLREAGVIFVEGPPVRVLFLVSQEEPSVGRILYWWKDPEKPSALSAVELALNRVFQERGFQPVQRLLKLPEGGYSPEMKALDLSDEDAIRWGELFSADAVIWGKCEIIERREIYLLLKVLHVENGVMIARDMQTESMEERGAGIEQVVATIERAVGHVAGRLSPEIMMAIERPQAKTTQLFLTLKGIRSFKDFAAFKDFLEKRVAGVKSVKQTRVKGDSVSVSVEYLGDEVSFLDSVSKHEGLPFLADLEKTEEGEILVFIR